MTRFKSHLSRRRFLQSAAVGAVGSISISNYFQQRVVASDSDNSWSQSELISSDNTFPLAGVFFVTSTQPKPRLDLISLQNGRILKTFEGIDASHAVVPVESLNRFFVHGQDVQTKQGRLLGLEINPETEDWSIILDDYLEGGNLLHWQPNYDYSLIQYNSIENQTLHVLDPKTLNLQTYQGGGTHSNMAFFNDDRWLLATDHLGSGTRLKIIDRITDRILADTAVGNWGHGLTVNEKTGRAFVWAAEGVHIVSLAKHNLGTHLGLIEPLQAEQRCWFCWTPQGGRYSHDQTFNPGDRFSPWLTVLDMEKAILEKIEIGNEQGGTLQISPDGKVGLCGSHNSNNVCLFDIEANRLLGNVPVGKRGASFFDRDAAFSKDRTVAFVTNPPEQTITIIDIAKLEAIGKIKLPATPSWMKVLTS